MGMPTKLLFTPVLFRTIYKMLRAILLCAFLLVVVALAEDDKVLEETDLQVDEKEANEANDFLSRQRRGNKGFHAKCGGNNECHSKCCKKYLGLGKRKCRCTQKCGGSSCGAKCTSYTFGGRPYTYYDLPATYDPWKD